MTAPGQWIGLKIGDGLKNLRVSAENCHLLYPENSFITGFSRTGSHPPMLNAEY